MLKFDGSGPGKSRDYPAASVISESAALGQMTLKNHALVGIADIESISVDGDANRTVETRGKRPQNKTGAYRSAHNRGHDSARCDFSNH